MCAFCAPDLRKKGIFSSILAAACEEDQIPGEGSVYFSCGTENKLWKCPGTYWAEHAWDEYMMERELTGFETMANEKQQICLLPDLENTSSTAWQAVGSRSLLTQNTAENLTAPEVTCFLAPQGNSVYLYSLEVLPELRNKHLGTAFLSVLLPQLAKKALRP